MSDLNTKLGAQTLSGTGTAGQMMGLRNVTAAEAVTFTSATPTLTELLRRIAAASSRIASALYRPPTAIVMHSRRWAWVTMQQDSSNRPMVVPEAYGPTNAAGTLGTGSEGRVGTLAGFPVYVDANIPTNVNTNQDIVLVIDAADTLLFESTIRTRVLPETLADTLTVRLQAYQYAAVATRQGKSVAVISGTGLVTPAFTWDPPLVSASKSPAPVES